MSPAWRRRAYPASGLEVLRARARSGLEVHLLPRPGYRRKFALLAVRCGAADGAFLPAGAARPVELPDGTAHFLEHCLFEDARGSVFRAFAAQGASANAYTMATRTCYLFGCTDRFEASLRSLLRFVGRPGFREAQVRRERLVIEQEIRSGEDSAGWRAHHDLLGALFLRHPVRTAIAGDVESIRRIDARVLDRCYRAYYRPEEMLLVASGELDPGRLLDLVDAAWPRRRGGGAPSVRRLRPAEPRGVRQARVERRMDVSQPYALVGFKDPDVGYGGERLLRKSLEVSMVLEMVLGRGGALFHRLYEAGLVDDGFGSWYAGGRDHGYAVLGGETPGPERFVEATLSALDRARRRGLSRAAFCRLKRKTLGRHLRYSNSLEFVAHQHVAAELGGYEAGRYLGAVDDLDLGDCARRLELQFDESCRAVATVLPLQ
ncbi:MAG: insulinase family protein [Planctomycetes bacterium]|nr:insulinase family protein [Planctomycetota bacterium]